MSEDKNRSLVEQFMQIQGIFLRNHHHHHHNRGLDNPYRGQGRVLKILKLKPEITQKELLELLDMRPQSLGTLLRKLEQKGYVTRTPSEHDKRAMTVRLTEKGAKTEIKEDQQAGPEALFDCLSDEEQLQLSGYLERIINNWREREPRGRGFDRFDMDTFMKWHR